MAAKIRGRIATNPESRTDGADPVVTGAKFVDAEADHGAEGLVDDIDAKAREVDDELPKSAAFEHRLVETHSLVQSDRMRRQPAGTYDSVRMGSLLRREVRARGGRRVDAPILAG